MHLHQMDAVSAYLNCTWKETVYMEQLEIFGNGSVKVRLLKKSIKNFTQSGSVWNETVNDEFLKKALQEVK